jgi:ketosteroid isomerase-like protein
MPGIFCRSVAAYGRDYPVKLVEEGFSMQSSWRLLCGLVVLAVGTAIHVVSAQAQLVDTPQNLLKAWTEAHTSRSADAMAKLYAKEAHLWGLNAKELATGSDNIKRYYERIWQNFTERAVTITKSQTASRRRVTIISGTMEFRSKSKDGVATKTPARFTMSVIRESRRQWSIVSHHVSPLAN